MSCLVSGQSGQERSAGDHKTNHHGGGQDAEQSGHMSRAASKHGQADQGKDDRATEEQVLARVKAYAFPRRQRSQNVQSGRGGRRVLRYLLCVSREFHVGSLQPLNHKCVSALRQETEVYWPLVASGKTSLEAAGFEPRWPALFTLGGFVTDYIFSTCGITSVHREPRINRGYASFSDKQIHNPPSAASLPRFPSQPYHKPAPDGQSQPR